MQRTDNSLFVRGPSIGSRLLLLMLLSVVLMTMDHRMKHLEALRSALLVMVYPVQYLAQLPFEASEWASQSFAERDQLLHDNNRLNRQALEASARLQRLDSLQAENQRLRALLQSSRKVDDRILIAELLSVDLDPYKHELVLNRGSQDGAFIGQPVLDSRGVMGQLIHISPVSAVVMLITDPNHAIPVQSNRTGARTVALGSGSLDRLSLPYLAKNADVQEGDLFVTSGLGGRFPAGYPVARIASIERDPSGSFSRIVARPTAELDRAREVLLVWSGLSAAEMDADLGSTVAADAVSPADPSATKPDTRTSPRTSPRTSEQTPAGDQAAAAPRPGAETPPYPPTPKPAQTAPKNRQDR